MNPFRLLPLLLLSTALTTACSMLPANQKPMPVKPGQFFSGSVINVHAPDSEGWLVETGRNGMGFFKRGSQAGATYAAQAITFEMPAAQSKEEFINFIKTRISTINPPPRFLEKKSSYQYTESRGYPCLNVHITYDDTAAVLPTGGRDRLELQVIALYCRHPALEKQGFFAAYSHRAKITDTQMEGPANSFIEGVTAVISQ